MARRTGQRRLAGVRRARGDPGGAPGALRTSRRLVIFVAALQSIPKTLREAARVDGANTWQEFWLVVVPLLSRTVLLTSVLTVISSLQVFVIFQLLTRGGPQNQTQTLLLSIYENAFKFANNLGLSAAMSMMAF